MTFRNEKDICYYIPSPNIVKKAFLSRNTGLRAAIALNKKIRFFDRFRISAAENIGLS